MKKRILQAYERKSLLGILGLWLAFFLERDPIRRLSAQNRLRDYSRLTREDRSFFLLHQRINKILYDQSIGYDFYDYGAGYFYQSYDKLGISGFRDTDARIALLQLKERLAGKKVIDIGCNSGFLLASLSEVISEGVGFDINPYQIKIARIAIDHLHLNNICVFQSSFEELKVSTAFDAVTSFANHSTFDRRTEHSLDRYFEKAASLLVSDGELIFESHAPQIENREKLEIVIDSISRYFSVEEVKQLPLSGFLDKDRTYIFARRS